MSRLAQLIDRTVATFSPQAAERRLISRQRLQRLAAFSALGAYANDGRPNTQVGQVGEVLRTSREQVQLMLNALNLIDNSGLASSITDKFGVYTFGNLRWQARTGDDFVNDQYEAYMRERLGTCVDITGRYCFREMAQIGMRGCIVKGGVGYDIIRPEPDHKQIYLRGVEYDRIGNPYYVGAQQYVVNGVHIDEMGREVSFDIYNRDRVGGMYQFAENVAKFNAMGGPQFLHVFRPGSGGFDAYKGTTAFKTAIDDVYYLDMIRRYELQAQQWAAAQSGVYFTDDKSIPPVGPFEERQNLIGQGQATFRVTPGVVQSLGTGERVEMFKNERPSANVQAMWLNVIRNICLATGLPFIFVYDEDGGGPGVRFAGAQADRTIQDWFGMFDVKFLSPAGNAILRNGIFVEKAIPYHPEWNRGRWLGPARLSVDAGYDSAAALNEVAECVRTRSDVCAEFGFDADEVDAIRRREVTRTIQHAKAIAKETGADFNIVLSMLHRGQNSTAGTGGVAAQVEAANASDDELSRGASSNGTEIGKKKDSEQNGDAIELKGFKRDANDDEHSETDGKFVPKGGGGNKSAKSASVKSPATEKRTAAPQLSEKAQRAKAAHVMIDKTVQRYAEEHNEPRVAKALGGISFPNGEPIDIAIAGPDGRVKHGVELKTVVKNANGKITMKGDAIARKRAWERKNRATIHTVVIDDTSVMNAKGEGKHDESRRKIYYRRGYGSFRIASMHPVSDMKSLRELMDIPTRQLPPAAK